MQVTRTVVGVDIAKRVFQLRWVELETGELMNVRLTRAKFLEHFANHAPCLVAVAATWRRRSVSALLQSQAAVFRVSESSGGRRGAGADVLSARCPSLPAGRVVNRGGRVGQKNFPPAGRRVSAGFLLRPHERSVHGGCGEPVLDVDVAHLGLFVEVAVRRLRVVGRRRDHGEPERGAGGRRGRPAVDVMRHGEPGRDVDVRCVDLDGGQVVEGDRGFARAGLGIADDSVGGCRVGCLLGCARNLTSADRDRRRPQKAGRPAGRRRERRFRPRGVRALRRRRPPQR